MSLSQAGLARLRGGMFSAGLVSGDMISNGVVEVTVGGREWETWCAAMRVG